MSLLPSSVLAVVGTRWPLISFHYKTCTVLLFNCYKSCFKCNIAWNCIATVVYETHHGRSWDISSTFLMFNSKLVKTPFSAVNFLLQICQDFSTLLSDLWCRCLGYVEVDVHYTHALVQSLAHTSIKVLRSRKVDDWLTIKDQLISVPQIHLLMHYIVRFWF